MELREDGATEGAGCPGSKEGEHFQVTLEYQGSSRVASEVSTAFTDQPFDEVNRTENPCAVLVSHPFSGNKCRKAP